MVSASPRPGPIPTPRIPDLRFDVEDVPEQWFDGDPARTASWNALCVVVAVAERSFVDIGRWLVERIEDDDIAARTTLFMQQEAVHSAMHGRMNRVLKQQGLPTDAVEAFAKAAVERVRAQGGASSFMSAGLAGEQVIGELAHAVLGNPSAMDGLPPKLRALFFWHWYEEVEHQASLHEGWVAVHGADANARGLRLLGVAYFLIFIGFSWPVATWAMSSPKLRRSPKHWRAVLGQMFVEPGLMRGVPKNLRSLARVDYHPSDSHDPYPTLRAYEDSAVRAQWEVPPKLISKTRRTSTEPVPEHRARSWLGPARYAVWMARHCGRFMLEQTADRVRGLRSDRGLPRYARPHRPARTHPAEGEAD